MVNITETFGTYAQKEGWLKPIDFGSLEFFEYSLYLPNNKWGYFIAHKNSSMVLNTSALVDKSEFLITIEADTVFEGRWAHSKDFDIQVPVEKAKDIPNLPETKLLIGKAMSYLKRASYGLEGCRTKEEVLKFVKSLD